MQQNSIEFVNELKYWEFILIGVFIAIWLLRLSFDFLLLFRLILLKKNKDEAESAQAYSIIQIIRNEEDNLREKLPRLLAYDYPGLEVIVVDDYSQDSSFTILGVLKEKYNNLKISSLNQEIRYSSKLARNVGIKAATNDWTMLLKPSFEKPDDSWLDSYTRNIKHGDLIIGYSNITRKSGLFNWLYRVELFFQQLNSYGFIKMGVGYVVTEDNIAFKKQRYFDVGGFAGEMNEDYANMEFLINKFLKKKSTTVLFSKESGIWNDQEIKGVDFKELLLRTWRIKHKLNLKKRFVLFIDNLLRILYFPVLIVLLFILSELLFGIIIIVSLKLFIHMYIVFMALRHLNERKIFISSLIYEMLTPYLKLILRWLYRRPLHKHKWNK